MVIRFNVRNNKIVDVRGKQQTAHGLQSSKTQIPGTLVKLITLIQIMICIN